MLRFDRAYSPQKEVREKCIEATRFARVPGGQWEGATAAGTKLDEQFEKYPKFEINKVATELNRIIAESRFMENAGSLMTLSVSKGTLQKQWIHSVCTTFRFQCWLILQRKTPVRSL